jgi:hypothetical protein
VAFENDGKYINEKLILFKKHAKLSKLIAVGVSEFQAKTDFW